jgi:hypothetical protein
VACFSPPSSTPTATATSGSRTVRHRARSLRPQRDRGAAGSWRRRAGVTDGGEHLKQDEESAWPRPQRARRPEGVLPPPCTGCGTSSPPLGPRPRSGRIHIEGAMPIRPRTPGE